MRNFYSAFLILNAFLLLSAEKITACGYDWVGECASSVHLRINGTLDSFAIADCPSGIRYNGLHLGTLQNLSLANAKAITWESCFNNVSAVALKYRVYEQGGGAGGFQTLNLEQDYFTLLGAYTTRYRSKASNIDLAAGLTLGKTYVLEVYLVAEVDTIGDDFIPETTLVKNNGGQNYRLTFTYGGPSASPFVVVPTIVKKPNCHGESNGTISVSVWGDHTGLFYHWSNVNLNFYQQNNLPAGTYTVTVTGANYAESQTIVLGQPDALAVQATNVQPVVCGGGLGSITLLPSGGTAPYQYLWQNGQTTAMATFPNSGNYSVSITDAQHCLLVQTVNLPNGGLVQQSSSAKICAGGSILVHGQVFDAPGTYNILVPGNGGCDTLLTLTISEIDPAALLANLPSNVLVSCAAPLVNLCAQFSPAATYQWSKDGIPATQTPCLLASAGGVYTLMVTLDGCSASKSIASEEHLIAQPAQFVGRDTITCTGFGTTPTLLVAVTNALAPTFLWTYNGQFLSSNDSCWFVTSSGGFDFVLPTLMVIDVFGCTSQAQEMVLIVQATFAPTVIVTTVNASGPGSPDGSASVQVGGIGPFEILWSNGQSGASISNLLPGTYCVTVTGANGCASSDCEDVGFVSGTVENADFSIQHFPNPAIPGEWLQIELPKYFSSTQILLELTDSQGKVIFSEKLENPAAGLRFQLPEAMPAGVCLLRVSSVAGQAIGKLLLKN